MNLLISDIKKYHTAGLFGESVYLSWKTFLDSFPEEYGKIPQQKPQWPVGTLLRRESAHIDIDPDIVLPPKIVQLRQSEIAPKQQVHTDNNYISYLTFDPASILESLKVKSEFLDLPFIPFCFSPF